MFFLLIFSCYIFLISVESSFSFFFLYVIGLGVCLYFESLGVENIFIILSASGYFLPSVYADSIILSFYLGQALVVAGFLLSYFLTSGSHAFSPRPKIALPLFARSFPPWVIWLKLIFVAYLFVWVFFLPDRGLLRGLAEGGAYFGSLALFAMATSRQRLFFWSLSFVAIILSFYSGLRMVLFSEILCLTIFYFRGRVFSKFSLILSCIISAIAFSVFGLLRFGLAETIFIFESGEILRRLFFNNFAGSISSSFALLHFLSGLDPWRSFLASLSLILPLPTRILPSEFYFANNLAIPGGGMTFVFPLLGLGLGSFLWFFLIYAYRRYIIRGTGLSEVLSVLLLLSSIRVFLYSPVILSTYSFYAFVVGLFLIYLGRRGRVFWGF